MKTGLSWGWGKKKGGGGGGGGGGRVTKQSAAESEALPGCNRVWRHFKTCNMLCHEAKISSLQQNFKKKWRLLPLEIYLLFANGFLKV